MAKQGINKVILIGNLWKDPEMRVTGGGSKVTTLSLVTSESWKDRVTGEEKESDPEWHRVVFFNNLAEIAGKYLHKGSKVYVEGKIHTNKWVDSKTDEKKYSTEIIGRELQFLDKKGDSDSQAQDFSDMPEQEITQEVSPSGIEDDDIPF